MPSDINLLPDDLRRAEEDEQRHQSHRGDDERRYSGSTPGPVDRAKLPAEPLVPVSLPSAEPPPRTSWFTRLLNPKGKAVSEPIKKEAPPTTVVPSSPPPARPQPPVKPPPPAVPAEPPKPAPIPPKAVELAQPASPLPRAEQAFQPPTRPAAVSPAPEPEPHQPWSWQSMLQTIRRGLGKSQATSMPPALEVNLVPREVAPPTPTNVWPLVGVVGGACALVAATYLTLGYLVNQKQVEAAEVEGKLSTLVAEAEVRAAAVEGIAGEVESVQAVRTLVANHVRWTKFFRWLEEHTLPDVYFAGFRGDIGGKFTLVASTKDFVTLSQQILVFQKAPEVLSVNVGEASRGGDSWVNFSLSFELSPTVLTSR